MCSRTFLQPLLLAVDTIIDYHKGHCLISYFDGFDRRKSDEDEVIYEGKDHDDSNSSAQQSLDLVVVRKQLEQQTEVVLQPFPLNTVHLEETQLLFSFVDCASEKLLRSIDVSSSAKS